MLSCVATLHFKSASYLSMGGWKRVASAAEDGDAFLEDTLMDTEVS